MEKQFKDSVMKLSGVCDSYADFVKSRIEEAGQHPTTEEREMLLNEVRLLNVIETTYGRCIETVEGQRSGNIHKESPVTLPL